MSLIVVRNPNTVQKCESGIPLAYLEGLEECYGLFLKDMEKMGSMVVPFNWTNFGDEDKVFECLAGTQLSPLQLQQWDVATQMLLSLLGNTSQLRARMVADVRHAADDELNMDDELVTDLTVEESYSRASCQTPEPAVMQPRLISPSR